MMTPKIFDKATSRCPICNSDIMYKYGKSKTGKQRYQCLICGRQFSENAKKQEIQGKPNCPECGKVMHLYKIENDVIRFRCSDYPLCKVFRKFTIKEEQL